MGAGTVRRVLTHNAEPDGRPVGVGFYHEGWEGAITRPSRVVVHEYPGGMVRKVFCDAAGRAYMAGWFMDGGW